MNKVINPPEDSMDAKAAIVHLAKEFEENFPPEYWDGEPLDYLEEIEKFAERRLLEEFGWNKKKSRLCESVLEILYRSRK